MKKTVSFVAAITSLMLLTSRANAQAEACDHFSFAVSGSRLTQIPITILRGGLSPVLEIAGKTYNYDITQHCVVEAGAGPKASGCQSALKIMVNKKVVALIEGQGRVTMTPTDEHGRRDLAQTHYEMSVERDPMNHARPRFVVEALGADGKVIGRLDGVEGLTPEQLTTFKGKLASAHQLIDLRAKNIVYANCRKLAVLHYDDSRTLFTPDRSVASKGAATPMGSVSSASVAPSPRPPTPRPVQR